MVSELLCAAEKYISYISCLLESWVSQIGFMSGFIWRLCFATTLYFAIVHNKKEKFLIKFEPLYHILAWGIGLLTAIICQVFGVFGQAGLFCWIVKDAQWARMGLFYIPLIVIIVIMAIIFLVIIISVRLQLRKSSYLKAEKKHIQELLIYQRLSIFLIAFVLGRIWSVTNRFYELIFNDSVFLLAIFHTIGSYSQGIVSAIVYGTTEKFHQKYWGLLKSCIRCIFRKKSKKYSSASAVEISLPPVIRSARERTPYGVNAALKEQLVDTTVFPPSPRTPASSDDDSDATKSTEQELNRIDSNSPTNEPPSATTTTTTEIVENETSVVETSQV